MLVIMLFMHLYSVDIWIPDVCWYVYQIKGETPNRTLKIWWHFLNSRYEYANQWVDDVIASQLFMYFVHRKQNLPYIHSE